MWQIYTWKAIRRNKNMGMTTIVAVLIASAFLSMMCGFAYITWADAVRRADGAAIDAGPAAPFILAALLIGLSVIWILTSAFSVSMQVRVRHMGILASIGATPKQLRTVLIQEALALSMPPVLAGILIGIGLNRGIVGYSNAIARQVQTDKIQFAYHWAIFFLTLVFCMFSVWLSALWCARKLSRLSPLEAIRGGEEMKVKKMHRFRLIDTLLGIEGTIARKSLYARRKAFRTSAFSLTLSVLVFSTFLNAMTLSDISTEQTYFERYKNTWDLRVVTEDVHEPELLFAIRNIPGVARCIANRKADMAVFLTNDMLSEALTEMGGPGVLQNTGIVASDRGYWVQAPIIILDDESFKSYCSDMNIEVPKQSLVAVNRIWDNLHSHYREPLYVDFLGEMPNGDLSLYSQIQGDQMAALPIGAYAAELPQIREEHQDFSLTLVMNDSTYQTIAGHVPIAETCYTVRTVSEADIDQVEAELHSMVAGTQYEIENRLVEAEYNVSARRALYRIIGVLCGMLALIGVANVFSNTLGQIYQRQREFARYISVGLSPIGVKNVLFFEGLIVALQPILLSLPIAVGFLALLLNASHLKLATYLSRVPIAPLVWFTILLWGAIALAYVLGYRALTRTGDLIGILKDDTMV